MNDNPARKTKRDSIEAVFAEARDELAAAGKPTPDLDAGILLEHTTGEGALTRLTAPRTTISARKRALFRQAIERRIAGEPVHRITGMREFYGLPLHLNSETLVPRPDTETLVDLVLPAVHESVRRSGTCRILDLGTGSGAIALALLSEEKKARAVASDISSKALAAARSNAEALDLHDRFVTCQSDWFSNVTGEFDIIVSNPPYIATRIVADLDIEVRNHDPILALDGGLDGLNAYGTIAARAASFMAADGFIAVEIGFDQRASVTQLFEAAGFRLVEAATDYGGNDRALCFRK